MRTQILCVIILVGIIPMIIFSQVILQSYLSKSITQRTSDMQSQGAIISNLVISSAFFSNEVTTEVNAELSQVSDMYNGRILVIDSNLQVVKDTYGIEEGKTIVTSEVVHCFKGDVDKYVSHKDGFLNMTIPIVEQETKEVTGVIVLSFSTADITKKYDELSNIGYTILLILAVIILVVSVLYSAHVTRPLKMITKSIDHITEGYLDGEISIRSFTETENISYSFNQMIEMLQKLEDSRQEFVSNVSHELKTPITSVKVLADSLIMQEEAPVELYREFLVDINNEIERVNQIINDLLTLVKMDKTASKVIISEVNVNEFIEKILKQLRPIAAKRNIELVYESFRPVVAQIDEVKMRMALTNLIENAIKYNYDDGWVRVSLNADHKFFYVKVADSGVGIPDELQDQVFERFYRVDKARSRETGGTGLGLAIARNAILLHRGSIKVYSKEKQGTIFTVRVPLNYLA